MEVWLYSFLVSELEGFESLSSYGLRIPMIDTKILTGSVSVSVSVGGKVYEVQPAVRQRCEGK
jgi:hypothetical protein